MILLTRINQFILLFVDTLRQIPRIAIWLPLLGYALLQLLVLYAHIDYLNPIFYGTISTWVRLFPENQATAFAHYPQHYLVLNEISGWSKLLVGLLLEGLVLGVVARKFAARFASGSSERESRSGLRWYLNLTVAWLVMNGVMLLVGMFMVDLVGPYLNGPRRMLAFRYGLMPLCFTTILALCYLAIPRIVMYGENVGTALWRSVTGFFRRPATMLALAAVVLALPVLLSTLASQPVSIIRDFRPELIAGLLAATIVFEMFAYFFWMGTATRFLILPED